MSERKYRQRGYQDSGRDRPEKKSGGGPHARNEPIGPRMLKMPGTHSVSRCGGCGVILPTDVDVRGKCPSCGFELHSCKQCAHFDPAKRFECTQPVTVRIAKKDARNECTFYAPRKTVERETRPSAARPDDPRVAFENLFKKS